MSGSFPPQEEVGVIRYEVSFPACLPLPPGEGRGEGSYRQGRGPERAFFRRMKPPCRVGRAPSQTKAFR